MYIGPEESAVGLGAFGCGAKMLVRWPAPSSPRSSWSEGRGIRGCGDSEEDAMEGGSGTPKVPPSGEIGESAGDREGRDGATTRVGAAAEVAEGELSWPLSVDGSGEGLSVALATDSGGRCPTVRSGETDRDDDRLS